MTGNIWWSKREVQSRFYLPAAANPMLPHQSLTTYPMRYEKSFSRDILLVVVAAVSLQMHLLLAVDAYNCPLDHFVVLALPVSLIEYLTLLEKQVAKCSTF
jgi:hypothetical protein